MIKFDSTDRSPDIILLIVTLILVTVGTVMIYSSSSIMAMERFKDGQFFLKKQMIFVVIGLGAMILMTRIPYEELKKFAYPGVIISLVLLTLVLIPKIGVRVGGADAKGRGGPAAVDGHRDEFVEIAAGAGVVGGGRDVRVEVIRRLHQKVFEVGAVHRVDLPVKEHVVA